MFFYADDDDIKWLMDGDTESAPLGGGPIGPGDNTPTNPND